MKNIIKKYKLIILGDQYSGKSVLLNNLKNNNSNLEDYKPDNNSSNDSINDNSNSSNLVLIVRKMIIKILEYF